MRSLSLIGVGVGDWRLLTPAAQAAIAELDVALVLDKRAETRELSDIRDALLDRYASQGLARIHLIDPPRSAQGDYLERVEQWHLARVELIEGVLTQRTGPDATIGILVWGDPAFYDSTLRIGQVLKQRANGALALRVIPGISSVQLLAAAFQLPLNAVNGAIHITTGRRLRDEGIPPGLDQVIVMLDGECSFLALTEGRQEAWEIFWGAYLGTPDEYLVQGTVAQVGEHIHTVRQQLRQQKGWLMDTYLLRRSQSPDGP